jgi:hypothetical protein
MESKTALKRAFLAAIVSGDAQNSQVLARRLKTERQPVLSLSMEHTNGVYILAGKSYDQNQIERYVAGLSEKYNIKYHVIDNTPETSNFDFLKNIEGASLNGIIIK